MVYPFVIFSGISEIDRGNAEVVNKRREIGTGPKRFNAQVGALPHFFFVRSRFGSGDGELMRALPYRQLRFRVFNIASNAVDELLEAMRSRHIQKAPVVAIRVDVDGGVMAQFVGVGLHPFGGTQQHRFLAIPRAVNNGAPRLPSLFKQ